MFKKQIKLLFFSIVFDACVDFLVCILFAPGVLLYYLDLSMGTEKMSYTELAHAKRMLTGTLTADAGLRQNPTSGDVFNRVWSCMLTEYFSNFFSHIIPSFHGVDPRVVIHMPYP